MAIYNATLVTSQVKNNGGTSLNSGSHDLFNSSAINILNLRSAIKYLPFGSTVVNGINTTNAHAYSFVVPRNNPKSLIKTALVSSDLISINNTIRCAGNPDPQLTSSVHYSESVRTRLENTANRENKFNIFTGKFSVGYPDVSVDYFGVDEAARTNRADVGRITFITNKNIKIQSYPSKTG